MKLRFTPRAAAELDAVLEFIDQRTPKGAQNVMKSVQETIELIRLYPEAGQQTSRTGLRRMVARRYPYLIFYRATKDEVIVHGVRHGARRS